MKKLCLLVILTLVYLIPATAQSSNEPSRTVDIGASIQASQSDINISIWLNNNVIFSPSISAIHS